MTKRIIRNQELRVYAARNPSAHGGAFQRTRYGRSRPRPLSSQASVHLTLRSSRAKGPWSFRMPQHVERIQKLTAKFTHKYGIRLHSMANVGNHLHLHLQLGHRQNYAPFIRALTAAIAMAVSGKSRWKKSQGKFWDQRPFTRLVVGKRAFLRLQDYIEINVLEGYGALRNTARWIVDWRRRGQPPAPV